MSASAPSQRITTPRLNFLIALFPGFQLLDVAGPLDMFNFLSSPPYSAPITMKFVAESRDAVGTKLVDLPGDEKIGGQWEYDVHTALGLGDGEAVNARWNQKMVVDASFDEVLAGLKRRSQTAGEKDAQGEEGYDVLFIPGGVGSRLRRRLRRSGAEEGTGDSELAVQPLIDFIKAIKPHLSLGIMTVCTGSDILGYTGLLDGRRATTNMSRFADVAGRHTGVNWQKGARWVKSPREEDADAHGVEIWTSAGVSAGMDLALAFLAEKFGGVEVARGVAKKSEYDWSEPKDGEICRFYKEYFDV